MDFVSSGIVERPYEIVAPHCTRVLAGSFVCQIITADSEDSTGVAMPEIVGGVVSFSVTKL